MTRSTTAPDTFYTGRSRSLISVRLFLAAFLSSFNLCSMDESVSVLAVPPSSVSCVSKIR